MSFNERWTEAVQGQFGKGEEWDTLRKTFPTLADVLLGVSATKDSGGRPRCKILLFAEADKLKFMLSPVEGNLVAFGTLPDPTGGFPGIEQELEQGRFEWKKRRR